MKVLSYKNMKTLNVIEKTRQYLDYIEEHVKNVEKAWQQIQIKCSDMFFVKDEYWFGILNEEIKNHDLSKLSSFEFVQYRQKYFPTKLEKINKDIENFYLFALVHHIEHNDHHWETWTKINYFKNKKLNNNMKKIHCVHMIIDWTAMGYKFNDSAKEFYEKREKDFLIPKKYVKFMYEIFDRLKK